ncbi:MAG: tetratricopeptide repeat protein [Kiritimatiellae bacterium]|nr:tetratricopeptide repeat protein [Kiritimatiellia bacterium]
MVQLRFTLYFMKLIDGLWQMTRFRPYVFIVLAVLAVFARAVGFSYIGLDDAGYTFRNPFVATGFSWANVVECFTNFRHGGIWMPLTYITYMIDMDVSRITGMQLSAWMHLVNVLLHALNTVLLLFLVRRLAVAAGKNCDSLPVLIAALFWALHPMRVEPVAWIACRKELLWVFFTLGGLVFWLKYLTASVRNAAAKSSLVLSFLSCVAACLCKPTAMCFPILAGALHLLLRSGAGVDGRKPGFSAPSVACYIAMFTVAGGTAIAAAYSQTHVAGQEAVALFAAPFHHRVVHALSALGFYFRAAVWPRGLHVDFRIEEGLIPQDGVANLIAFAVAAMIAVLVIVYIWRNHCPGAMAACLFSLAWFMVPIAPTLGLFGSFGIEAHADRFTYLPAMAIVFLAALCPVPDVALKRFSDGAFFKVALMVVAVYGVFAFRQAGFWRDDYTAHLRALDCDPEHPRAMVHVGDALCARVKDFDRGIAFYRRSLSLRPREYVKYRLAYALASRGRWEDRQEVKRLGAEVVRNPSLDQRGMMLDALGTVYMAEGDWETAIRMFEASIAAPGRFWPKGSTKRKLDECIERIR